MSILARSLSCTRMPRALPEHRLWDPVAQALGGALGARSRLAAAPAPTTGKWYLLKSLKGATCNTTCYTCACI